MYAKQLGVQSWAMKLPVMAAVWLVLLALSSFMPTADGQNRLIAYFQNSGGIGLPYFALLSAILVSKIRKVVTSVYARPMTWMYVYLIVNVVTSALANLPFGTQGGTEILTIMVLYGVPDQFLLMITGYSFKKELSK